MNEKKLRLEFFCGTGGVGKTTLSAARALCLAKNQRVLLMTIDPSLRLKDLLGIEKPGTLYQQSIGQGILYSMLLSTEESMQRVLSQINAKLENHRILNLLARPFGGLNEILALVELGRLLKEHSFDVVIIDTPPGGHFLEFLDGLERIKSFFDETFVSLINRITDHSPKSLLRTGLWFKNIMQSGVEKLLDYLGKVTGQGFVQEFLVTIKTIYQVKEPFLHATEQLDRLSHSGQVTFYLVTHAEHNKGHELISLKKALVTFPKAKIVGIINYSSEKDWGHDLNVLPDGEWKEYTQHLIQQNTQLLDILNDIPTLHQFPKSSAQSQQVALDLLVTYWEKLIHNEKVIND